MKILMATGGSGGHIFPALVTAEELRRRGHVVYFAGALGEASYKIQDQGFEFFEIRAKGFSPRSLAEVLSFCSVNTQAFWGAVRVLQKIMPDIVVGFGGYGSFPITFAAALQGYPTLIHEQNVLPGKANKVLAIFARKVAVSFEAAVRNFHSAKVVLTGCPCRKLERPVDRAATIREFGLREDLPTLLVLGGSQGSRAINHNFILAAEELKNKIPFQVIHMAGQQDVQSCQQRYLQLGITAAVFAFGDDMAKVYNAADLVISRAGAMTITEIASLNLPAILIPYPYAGGHQKQNALILSQTGASRMIEEKDLSPQILSEAILEHLDLKMSREDIRRKYSGVLQVNARESLAELIESSAK